MILSLILAVIFFILGIIHLNWFFGGRFGFKNSLPTKETGERVLNPKKIDIAMVGLGLFFFGLFYVLQSGMIHYYLPEWVLKYGSWIISAIFILRAIGEFKYVGFFKQVKQTDFGQLDTKLFSPLCLTIGLVALIIEFIK